MLRSQAAFLLKIPFVEAFRQAFPEPFLKASNQLQNPSKPSFKKLIYRLFPYEESPDCK